MIKKLLVLTLFPLFIYAKNLTFAAIDFPPYISFENGEAQGFNVEILNTIFERMNMTVVYKKVPWARALIMLKKGDVDALFPMLITEERKEYIDFTHSYTSEPFALFAKKDSTIIYHGDLKALSLYSFGRVRGYSSGKKFDEAVESGLIQLSESIDSEQNLSKFLKGRFDILVDNQYYILYHLKKLGKLNEVTMLKPLLSNSKSYLGFSKVLRHQETIERFNDILEEIIEDGTYDAIINKYFKH